MFLILAILVALNRYLIVVFVGISPLTNGVQHLLTYLSAICWQIQTCLFRSFAHFSVGLSFWVIVYPKAFNLKFEICLTWWHHSVVREVARSFPFRCGQSWVTSFLPPSMVALMWKVSSSANMPFTDMARKLSESEVRIWGLTVFCGIWNLYFSTLPVELPWCKSPSPESLSLGWEGNHSVWVWTLLPEC